MKNFVQEGEALTLTAPYAVSSGGGFKVGSIIAIAATDADNAATVVGYTEGVFTVAKTSAQAWTVGALVYWDNSNKVFTTTSSSNTLAGVATAVAANPSSTGQIRLNGSF